MSDIIDDIHQEALGEAEEGFGGSLFDFIEMQQQFGSPDSLSTGFPNWDLLMYENKRTGVFGFPYGRVCGMFGEEETYKTSTLNNLLAKNIKKGGEHLDKRMGGISLLLSKEGDYDLEYLSKFLRRVGIMRKHYDQIRDQFKCAQVSNFADIAKISISYLDRWNDYAEKLQAEGKSPHEHIPRIMIGVDSVGATPAETNQERIYEEGFEEGDQRGAKAKEIHRMFQNIVDKVGRIGCLYMYVNHYRDNQGYGNKKHKEAHKSALKYYSSCSVEVKKGYRRSHVQKRKHNKREYRRGWIFTAKVDKIRQSTTLSGETEIDFYENVGLDRTDAIMKGMHMSGVCELTAGKYVLDFDDEDELSEYNGKYTKDDLRELIYDDFDFRTTVVDRIYENGPVKVQWERKDTDKVLEG